MAVLTQGLRNFERQLDEAFPRRARPDGWIGDEAHRQRTSGHNPDDTFGSKPAWDGDTDRIPEVRSLDIKVDLGDGIVGQDLVDHLIQLPALGTVIRYLIHRGLIYHARAGFRPVRYDGDNRHDHHVHVEGAWTQAGDTNTTYDYLLEDIPVALTENDWKKLSALVATHVEDAMVDAIKALTTATPLKGPDGKPDGTVSTPLGHHVLSQGIPNPLRDGRRDPAWKVLHDLGEVVAGQQLPTTPPAA